MNLIFDAGPLINFSMNCSLNILKKLKENFKGDFLITKEVKQEIIEVPQKIKRFKLGALKLKKLFDEGIIKHADISKKQINELREKRDVLMNIANNTFKAKGKSIHLIDKGESATFALSLILKQPNILVIDERTARMLVESPENLKKLLNKKLNIKILANESNYSYFRDFKIIRSTELAYVAYKKGLFDFKGPEVLEAMLYGLKYKGCSISEKEIEEMKNL